MWLRVWEVRSLSFIQSCEDLLCGLGTAGCHQNETWSNEEVEKGELMTKVSGALGVSAEYSECTGGREVCWGRNNPCGDQKVLWNRTGQRRKDIPNTENSTQNTLRS